MPSTSSLPHDAATLQQMVRELLATITELRSTVEKQQAHIQYLVRMTFGRRSDRERSVNSLLAACGNLGVL